jgi:diphthamide synthase (EF-2-diphthine--ammonia ligase)
MRSACRWWKSPSNLRRLTRPTKRPFCAGWPSLVGCGLELLAPTAFRGLYPLWQQPTRELAERFIAAGFVATLVCTDNTQIDPSFAGRSFDHALLGDLPATADPCGENGEFHTFVSGGPIFRQPVAWVKGDTVTRDGRFTYCDLLETESVTAD